MSHHSGFCGPDLCNLTKLQLCTDFEKYFIKIANIGPLQKIPCCALLSPSHTLQPSLYLHLVFFFFFFLGLISSGICVSTFVGWCESIHVYDSFENLSWGSCMETSLEELHLSRRRCDFSPLSQATEILEGFFFSF